MNRIIERISTLENQDNVPYNLISLVTGFLLLLLIH